MIRRSLFCKIDGFDESLFLYFEDDDLSIRLYAMRELLIYVHDARAVHHVGTSTPSTSQYIFTRNFHNKRSENSYPRKI
jgi:N-acetylglucosaminyl-diphospho-decaprenol L-rhamnosyltransferase